MNDLFDISGGIALRDLGIKRAVSHADREIEAWSDLAWDLFLEYIHTYKIDFMAEDVRAWAHTQNDLPQPPSARAWGGIMLKAAKQGIIHRVGYAKVKARNCHCTPAAVWRAV